MKLSCVESEVKQSNQPAFTDQKRREILKMGLCGLLGSIVPVIGSGSSAYASSGKEWRASMRNAHTGERFDGVYRVGDEYLPEAFAEINYLLRDFRTREMFPMDPRVIDIISLLQRKTGRAHHMEVLSGYRSPRTNAMLNNAGSGVARNSYHMYGQAVDILMPGFRSRKLRQIALDLRAGGVGYYPKSDFVHVDTGKIRSW